MTAPHDLSSASRTKARIAQDLARVLVGFSVVTALLAPILEADQRNTVWIYDFALLAYVGLERYAASRWPGRPLSLLRAAIFIATWQPIFLILSLLIEGEATYSNWTGHFSHTDQAWLVALTGVFFYLMTLFGAALAGRSRPAPHARGIELSAGYSRWFFLVVSWLAAAHALTRMAILFASPVIPVPVAYALRLYLSIFLAVFVFLGMALRKGHREARAVTPLILAVALVVLVSGSRSDALYPPLFMSIGYVLARPVERWRLVRWATVAVPLLTFAMYLGGAVRADQRGRTGEAAVARVDELGQVLNASGGVAPAAVAAMRRMVSDSNHSVISRIPKEIPFEQDGLIRLPEDFLDRLLPRFNLSGISETETPRNWMLNGLGFLVNWATSVELTLVSDAWYRGGFLGLIVVGLLLGFVFQALENAVYARMVRVPQLSAILVFNMAGLLLLGGRDAVAALRSMTFLTFAGLILVALARLLEARRSPGPANRAARPLRYASMARRG